MTNGPRPPVPEKKGLSPWVWLGIGCAGLIVMGMVAFSIVGYLIYGKARDVAQEVQDDPVAAAARVIAATNPEVELVEADKDNRIVVFRNTTTGEELTFSYEDIEEGRFSFTSGDEAATIELDTEGEAGGMRITTDEGTARFGAGSSDAPAWVPVYPSTEPQGAFASETPEGRAGAFTFETGDGLDAVVDFYVSELEGAGFVIQSRTTTPDGAFVVATDSADARTATLTVSIKEGGVEGVVNFTEKKQ